MDMDKGKDKEPNGCNDVRSSEQGEELSGSTIIPKADAMETTNT